ncbi:MAG: TolC family protein [Armatimonadetes bacterium]|nr:TolC family protein [Armatimonadota bacterium]MDW8122825.1 TolC family protein [Armatimonadota bacterium]
MRRWWWLTIGMLFWGSTALFAQPLTLDRCIQMALASHPSVQIALNQKEQATARRRQAEAQLLPDLSLNATGRFQGPIVTFLVPLPTAPSPQEITIVPSLTHLVNVELRQSVYSGGRFGHAIRGARHYEMAAEKSLEASRRQLILNVTEAYADLVSAQEMERVALQAKERVMIILQTAKARVEAGVAPKFDVLRAEAEMASVEEQLLQAHNAVLLAMAALNEWIGQPPRTKLELVPLQEPPDIPTDRWDDPRLTEQALALRPEMQALHYQIEARRARVRFARADSRPLAFLSSNYQQQQATGFTKGFQWGISLLVQFPIFDSGRRQRVLEEEEAALQQTLWQREQLAKAIRLEVDGAIRGVQLGYQRMATARSALSAAEEAFRLAKTRYEAGVGTLVEVWDAQVALTRARASFVQALYDTHKALARLSFATATPLDDILRLIRHPVDKNQKDGRG